MNPADIVATADTVARRLAPVASDAWAMARQRVLAQSIVALVVEGLIIALMAWMIGRPNGKSDDPIPGSAFFVAVMAIALMIGRMWYDVTALFSLDYMTAKKLIDLVKP